LRTFLTKLKESVQHVTEANQRFLVSLEILIFLGVGSFSLISLALLGCLVVSLAPNIFLLPEETITRVTILNIYGIACVSVSWVGYNLAKGFMQVIKRMTGGNDKK
jgi:hypothetical protein